MAVIHRAYHGIYGIDWRWHPGADILERMSCRRRVPFLVPARVCLLLAASLALTAGRAAAQGPPAFSVTVTAADELVEAVGTTRRIGRAEIEARHARTLDEALRLFPGIYVRTGGDGTPRIDVRGFRSRHVLLLVNGVLGNSAADGQFDPARISTQAIRGIKVSYGSSSVLYGDNALAAVIEITTSDASADATLDVSAGTPDQKGAGARVARTVGNWSFMLAAAGYETNGFRVPGDFSGTPLEDGGRRQNSDRGRADVRGGLGYRFSPALAVASEWSVGTGSYGVPSGVIADAGDIFAQTPRFERVEDYRAASGQVSVQLAPRRRFDLRAWVYRNAQREDRARYDDRARAARVIYVGIDDTDVVGSPGTNQLARAIVARLGAVARGAIVCRHQLFVHPAIPYTSQNGSASIQLPEEGGVWRARRRR